MKSSRTFVWSSSLELRQGGAQLRLELHEGPHQLGLEAGLVADEALERRHQLWQETLLCVDNLVEEHLEGCRVRRSVAMWLPRPPSSCHRVTHLHTLQFGERGCAVMAGVCRGRSCACMTAIITHSTWHESGVLQIVSHYVFESNLRGWRKI